MKHKAILDLDFPKYSVASVGDRRFISVRLKNSKGKPVEYENITKFWGRGKKIGGVLEKINNGRLKKGLTEYKKEDFEIENKVEQKEALENVLHSAKSMVSSAIRIATNGGGEYQAFIGKGDSFRKELSTLKEYKGNRTELIKPTLLESVSDYLEKKFDAIVIEGIEADDACVMAAYGKKENVIVGVDKDYYGSECLFYNVNRPKEGIVDCAGFGKLYMEEDKVRGQGRIFKYLQVLSEDNIDNYKANCFSDIKWSTQSAYKALVDCQCDKDAYSVLVEKFKLLYPEEIVVTGWRGDSIKIDWKYVLQEMLNMAHLHRFKNDFINLDEKLKEYGIK